MLLYLIPPELDRITMDQYNSCKKLLIQAIKESKSVPYNTSTIYSLENMILMMNRILMYIYPKNPFSLVAAHPLIVKAVVNMLDGHLIQKYMSNNIYYILEDTLSSQYHSLLMALFIEFKNEIIAASK